VHESSELAATVTRLHGHPELEAAEGAGANPEVLYADEWGPWTSRISGLPRNGNTPADKA
jgi:hypothetical protein